VIDHHDGVGELVGLLEVLGGEHHGRALVHQRFDDPPQFVAALRVETGRRLVEEEHRRSVHEGGGEVEASAHPAGVGAGDAVAGLGEAELLEQLAGAPVDLLRRQVRELADEREVLAPGEVLVDRGVLTGETDLGPHELRVVAHVDAEHARRAVVGTQQRREHAHGRGLAGTVGPEEPEHLTLAHLERDPLHGFDVTEPLHEVVGDHCQLCHPFHAIRGCQSG
jgi:hypothetical protein